MNPIFTNNKNSTVGHNPFNTNNRPGVNLFTNNKTQDQNQNIQNQSVVMPNQSSPPASKPNRQNPRIKESLQQKHSFATILQKVTCKQKVTKDQITTGQLNFVTKMGLLIFEADEQKKYHFLNVKSKQPHLGYGSEVIVHKGQIPKCDQINQIWNKLVKHFAYICETNEMNGYFLLKKILSQGRYYQQMYRPKQGLSNKVFEPNFEYLKSFFIHSQTSGKPDKLTVNVSGKIYVEILTKMIENYQIEWLSFFEIIEKVGQGKQYSSQYKNYVRQSGQKKNRSIHNQPVKQPHTLNFYVLHQENIMGELWKAYKKFALSEAKQPAAQSSKVDIPKKKWTDIKRIFFTKVGNLINKLLDVQYNQEILMENQPIPLSDAIEFVTKDIEKVQIENLIEPQMENVYIESGLNLILALIPFASYIQHDDNDKEDDNKVITSYFNFPSQKNRFINARQVINRKELLHQLSKIKIDEFEPLVVWAKLELKRIQIITGPSKILESQREKERKQEAVETWEKYFEKGSANYDIFEEHKWKHWVGLFVENLSIDAIIQSTILRNLFIYYCKRVVKDRRAEFFKLWESIIRFKYSPEYRDMESTLKYLQVNPTAEDRKKYMYVLPPKILRNYDLYTVGRFLREINKTNYLTQALNVFTTLIKRRKDQDASVNYTKKLLFFLQNHLELPREEDFTTDLFEIVLGTLSLGFGICCKKKSLSNDLNDYSQLNNLKMEQTIQGQPVDYEVKFLCELVIQNMHSFETLQGYIFDSREHLSITNDFPGIRTCIFLCKILQKIIPNTTSNIKSIRYLIRTIDCLFTNKQTQEIIICALSVVFPYDLTSKNQINFITKTTERFMAQKPVRRCAWSIVEFVQLKHDSDVQSLKHVQKLRKTLSYHFNHMLKSCDSVEQYFIINKDQDQAEMYKTIEEQTSKWKFTTVSSLLNNRHKRFRASDWFYTFARVMQSNNLLPIDIDSIIESLRKMRIPNNCNYGSFEPMRILFKIINQGTVLDQMFKFLKPTGCEHKVTALIKNEKMAFYKLKEIQLQEPNGTRYNKYQNNTIVDQKTARLAMDEQYQLLRTICMYARLIEEILRLYLDFERFQSYSLIKSLSLVQQLIPKLTIHEHIHQFRAVSTDQGESGTKMNIIASLVALLNLYTYKCKFPGKISYVKQGLRSMLQILEESSINNIGEEDNWIEGRFGMRILEENMDFYELYRNEFQYVNRKYFESVLYQMTDFSFENDETSLRATVFSILQLLFENKCGKTVVQAISNYSYPIICTGNISDYSLTNKYLINNDHKNLTPLLFSHINHLLTLSSSPNSTLRERFNLPHIVRTIQALSVLVFEPFFANQVISSLQNIRRCFVQLITSDAIYNPKFCSKAQQINIINRISMFIQRIIQKAKNILPEDEFQKIIIQKFLINPQNILKLLFQRMTQLSKDFKIDKFSLIQTATDHVANYVMQVNLTRNALFRASYDMLIKIVFQVLQYLNKDQVAQIVSYLLFKNYELVTRKPKELKFQPEIIIKINLQPLEIITFAQGHDKTILITDLSPKVTNFIYCNRMNFRKYGPNFMYDTNLAFHIIKAENDEDVLNAEEKILNVRKQVFLIQLVNCMKSLYFSYQSMVKSYFRLMFLLTNTGPIGQNLSIYELDRKLPKAYESAILQNKYCLRNQFSLVQSLHMIKSDILMGNEQSIVSKIAKIMEEFLTIVQVEPQDFNVLFKEIAERETIMRGIPRNAIFVDRVFLETRVGNCLNPSHVVKLLRNISNALMDHLPQQQDVKSTAKRYIKFLQYFLHILTKFPFSLRVVFQIFSSILNQYSKIVQISTEVIRSALDENLRHSRDFVQNDSKNIRTTHEEWLLEKIIEELRVKQKVISTCSALLYKFYEGRKHSKLFGWGFQNLPASETDLISCIRKQELEKNIGLLCAITSQVYSESSTDSLFSTSIQQKIRKDIHSSVHYIMKLLMDNLESYNQRETKILIFTLCNKFYLVNSRYPVTQWQFHSTQFEKCKQILCRNVMHNEDPYQKLQKIIAFDSFCTFSLTNDIYTFQDQIVPILMRIIDFDNKYILKLQEKQSFLQNLNDRKSISHKYYPSSSKRYKFSQPSKEGVTIQKIVEYKKLLMTVLVTLPSGNWADNLFSVEANALYLEILKFKVIDFSASKLNPSKPIEEKLNQLIVTDEAAKNLFKKVPSYLQYKLQNNLQATSHINQKNSIPPRINKIASKEKYKTNQPLSTSSDSRMSLFDFIYFINQSQLIHTYLLILKAGIHSSKIFEQLEENFFQPDEQAAIIANIESKFLSLYEYFWSCSDILLDNPRMISNLTYLYNYICRDPSYIKQLNNLPIFFEEIDSSHVRNQLVFSIVEYCTVVAQLLPKIRKIYWKASTNRNQQRIDCLTLCARLLQKNKILNAFRQMDLKDKLYNSLKEDLLNQINEEKLPKNQGRSGRYPTNY